MGNVFGNAVGDATLDLVRTRCGAAGRATRDLADVLEYLGVLATVRSAGDEGGRVSDELFEVRQMVDGHDELRSALSDPAAQHRRQARAAGPALRRQGPAGDPAARRTGGQWQHTVPSTVGSRSSSTSRPRRSEEKLATVHTARELDRHRARPARRRRSRSSTPRTVHLQVVVDPDVVGGLRVEIGDDVIDGTVASRLDDAQRKLAG